MWLQAVPGLSTYDVTCDGDEVRVFFGDERPDEVDGLVVAVRVANLAKVQVSELHDDKAVVFVHLQMHAVQAVEIVLSVGCLSSEGGQYGG